MNLNKNSTLVLGRGENIVGKGENASLLGSLKVRALWGRVKSLINSLPDNKILDWSNLKQIAHNT